MQEYRRVDMVRLSCRICKRDTDQEIWTTDPGYVSPFGTVYCGDTRCLQCGLTEWIETLLNKVATLVDGYVPASA